MPESDAPKESAIQPCNLVFHVRTGEPLARTRFAVYDKATDELLALFFKLETVTDFMLDRLMHQRETYYKEL